MEVKLKQNNLKWSTVGGNIGIAAGYIFAYKKDYSVWGIIGFGILGSIIGSAGLSVLDKK